MKRNVTKRFKDREVVIDQHYFIAGAITPDVLRTLRNKFFGDSKNILASNACARADPLELCTSRAGLDEINHVFSHRVNS